MDFLTAARAEGGTPAAGPVLVDRVLEGLPVAGLDVVGVVVREGLFADEVDVWDDLDGTTVGRRAAPAVGVAAFKGADIIIIIVIGYREMEQQQ